MPATGMVLALLVTTGMRFSVCVPGCRTMRRPLISVSVLPVPRPRRLMEFTSPRAALTPVVVESLKPTKPICGIERSNSSPVAAPVSAMSSESSTETGRDPAISAPLI